MDERKAMFDLSTYERGERKARAFQNAKQIIEKF